MSIFFTRRRLALVLPIFIWYVLLSYGINAYSRGSEAGLASGIFTPRSAFWVGLPLGFILCNLVLFIVSRYINKVAMIILIVAQISLIPVFLFYSSGGV